MGKIFTITDGLENMGALRTGGQGSVYKGKRTGEIITAVKLLPTPIHAEDDQDKNFRDFQNEVAKLKKVNEEPNPNVVKILSSGITESGSLPFIEMEFIEGPDLEDLLKPPHDPVFTIRETIKVADQLSNALAHCHHVSVKHGDMKSNNVKLNVHSGNYMLLDFGLAVMSDEQRRTSLRHAGAIEFMAPEQNEGNMLFQTDVYSFGVILFELLAGTVPFPLSDNGETSRNSVMISHLEAPVPDIIELRKKNIPANWPEEKKEREIQVPQWLLTIIKRCLEKNPEDRFLNGMELHEAIVLNSTMPLSTKEYDLSTVTVLQSENERLKNLLLQYQEASNVSEAGGLAAIQEEATSKNAKHYTLKSIKALSNSLFEHSKSKNLRPVLLGLVILAILLAGFTFFNGKNSGKNTPDMVLVDTAAVNQRARELQDSIEALNAKRIKDSIAAAKRIYAAKAAAAAAASAGRSSKKGKNKKFFEVKFQ